MQYECVPESLRQAQTSTAIQRQPRRSGRIAALDARPAAPTITEDLSDWSGTDDVSESSFGASQDTIRIEDETTANAALITFAQGFCIFGLGAKGRWHTYRLPFHICDASKSGQRICESRVDGFYRCESAVIKAIVEVKPFRRNNDTDIQIGMQEASQMASWISEFPPPRRDTGRKAHINGGLSHRTEMRSILLCALFRTSTSDTFVAA